MSIFDPQQGPQQGFGGDRREKLGNNRNSGKRILSPAIKKVLKNAKNKQYLDPDIQAEVDMRNQMGGHPDLPDNDDGDEEEQGEGLQIIYATEKAPPHTYIDQYGKRCSPPWIITAFLIYDKAIGKADAMLGMVFKDGFSCYYPNSTIDDYKDLMNVASSGRWLHAWNQKGNYIGL